VREFNLSAFDELLADIGLGNRFAALIAKRLLPEDGEDEAVFRRPAPNRC
jgi:guanosine-3',5'-bis(diphosphate) 3'-pyrophosphohydrolase